MAGFGGFVELGSNIIESSGGIGLPWFVAKQFENFILRVDWRASAQDGNSDVFIRFPDPGNDWIPVAQGYEVQIDNAGKNPDTNRRPSAIRYTTQGPFTRSGLPRRRPPLANGIRSRSRPKVRRLLFGSTACR